MDESVAEEVMVIVGKRAVEMVVGDCAIVLATALVDETEKVVVDESEAEEEVIMAEKSMVEVAAKVYVIALVEKINVATAVPKLMVE